MHCIASEDAGPLYDKEKQSDHRRIEASLHRISKAQKVLYKPRIAHPSALIIRRPQTYNVTWPTIGSDISGVHQYPESCRIPFPLEPLPDPRSNVSRLHICTTCLPSTYASRGKSEHPWRRIPGGQARPPGGTQSKIHVEWLVQSAIEAASLKPRFSVHWVTALPESLIPWQRQDGLFHGCVLRRTQYLCYMRPTISYLLRTFGYQRFLFFKLFVTFVSKQKSYKATWTYVSKFAVHPNEKTLLDVYVIESWPKLYSTCDSGGQVQRVSRETREKKIELCSNAVSVVREKAINSSQELLLFTNCFVRRRLCKETRVATRSVQHSVGNIRLKK